MIKLTRIQKICSFVDATTIAEIGADHAYITKNLLDNKKIEFAVVTDISKKCLLKAQNNLKLYKHCTIFSVGNGLEALNNVTVTPQQIIIAGMGGQEIIKILKQDVNNKYTNFILQPQKNVVELRQYLQQNNFEILKDDIVQEGKMFYFVLKVQKTNKKQTPLSTMQTYFGLPTDKKTFKNYLTFELEKRQNISTQKKILENETLIRLIREYLQNL